jgi:hypothetical protein
VTHERDEKKKKRRIPENQVFEKFPRFTSSAEPRDKTFRRVPRKVT